MCIRDRSILILGDTADDMLDEAAKYDLDLTVFSLEGAENMAAAARRAGKKPNVQIKLNTGMTVSYTHLDVYKRQGISLMISSAFAFVINGVVILFVLAVLSLIHI